MSKLDDFVWRWSLVMFAILMVGLAIFIVLYERSRDPSLTESSCMVTQGVSYWK